MLKDHLNKLEYFCIIVESKSLLKASRRAYVSQPQLSKVLKQLEDDLGVKLLVRSSSGVTTTQAGEKLYSFAKETVNQANNVQLLVKAEKDVKGEVRIGTYDSISRYFFPSFLKYLKKSSPALTIILSTGRSRVMLEGLRKGTLDVAVVVSANRRSKNLDEKIIYSDSFGFYHSPQIESAFLNHLILFPLANHLRSDNFGFKYILSCDNLETVKSLAEQGLGVGFLPHRVAREGCLQGKLISHTKKIKELDSHNIVLAFYKGKLSPATQVVIDELERFLVSWSSS